jgi:hypothetical protein
MKYLISMFFACIGVAVMIMAFRSSDISHTGCPTVIEEARKSISTEDIARHSCKTLAGILLCDEYDWEKRWPDGKKFCDASRHAWSEETENKAVHKRLNLESASGFERPLAPK